MQIDISKLGYRWKGLYAQTVDYNKGDVVRKDNKVQYYDGSNFQIMGSGQLNAENKGELLTAGTNLTLTGKHGQQLKVQSDGSMAWEHTEGRHGTTVQKIAQVRNKFDGRYNSSGSYCFPHQNMGFLMTDGTVRVTGRGNEGQHGVGNTNDFGRQAGGVQVGFEKGIKIVDLYGQHHGGGFYAIDTDGRLWAWGNNNYGQLGIGNTSDNGRAQLISGRGDLPATAKVKSVHFGDANWWGYMCVFVQTEDGRIYSWGSNRYGALMHEDGSTSTVTSPKLVPISVREDITEIYAISGFYQVSFLKTRDGRLFTTGEYNSAMRIRNDNASYGHPMLWTPSIEYPVRSVTYEESDSHVSAGDQYYRAGAIVTEDNGWWTWGHHNWYNGNNVYVDNDSAKHQNNWIPKRWSTITDVKCGHNTNGHYGAQMVLKNDGTIWGIGYDGFGTARGGQGSSGSSWIQLGHGSDNKDIWFGGSRYGKVAYLVKNDGRVVWWGGCNYGISGTGRSFNAFNTEPVRLNKTITDIQISGYRYDDSHYLAAFYLTEDGTVYANGYNQYNMLGMDDDNEDIFSPTPVLF